MNKKKREQLRAALNDVQRAIATVEEIRDGEMESYDNLPDSLKNAELGERLEAAATALDTAYENLDTAADSIDEAINA